MPLIPINPALTETGSLGALVSELGDEGARPIALADDEDVLKGNFDVLYDDISIRVAAAAKVSPIFEGESTSSSRAVYFDAATYIDKFRDVPLDGPGITRTRWGVGLRIALKITNFDAKMKAGLGIIAASAELGLTTVKYHIQGLGLGVQGLGWVLSGFPAFGSFDAEAYGRIKTDVIAKLALFLQEHSDDLTPQAYAVDLTSGLDTDYVMEARSVLFAMNRIRDRKPLDEALEIGSNHFDLVIVRRVYNEIALGTPSDQKPADWAKKRAEEWLSI